MSIASGVKGTAQDAFKGALFPLIGAVIVYLAIRAYEKAR